MAVELLNIDCMEYMSKISDNFFEIAIVDPPYGLKKDSLNGRGKMKNRAILMDTSWDVKPSNKYFDELFRVSKNQIIWGGNYFELKPSRCIICWDKVQPWENFSQWEMAWTSFDLPASIFKFDNKTGNKIHPTQKPIELYGWLMKKYCNNGWKILDTHLGSGSSAIAAEKLGFDFVGCEIDKDYYDASVKRFEKETDLGFFSKDYINDAV